MEKRGETARRAAIDQAKANSALSGYAPSEYALSVYAQWVAGHWSMDEAVALLVQHHKELEAQAVSSDQHASPNTLGITDGARMKQAEADITTLRMAYLDVAV